MLRKIKKEIDSLPTVFFVMAKSYVYVQGVYGDTIYVDGTPIYMEEKYDFQSVYFPTVLRANSVLELPSPAILCENEPKIKDKIYLFYPPPKKGGGEIQSIKVNNESVSIPSDYKIIFPPGMVEIIYHYFSKYDTPNSRQDLKVTYTFSTVENHLPLAPYSITDCITRCLELAEPLQKGEIPRFRLEGVTYDASTGERNSTYTAGSQAERYDKVLAPPFTMTQCTLREQLKIIGGFIHAEPRLTDGVITFDPFCGNELAEVTLTDGTKIPLNQYPYAIRKKYQSINEYCTSVDTRAENLVNSIDKRKGSIIDPDGENYKSLRSETINARIEENNGEVVTAYPIYEIEKVMCGIAKRNPKNASDYWSLAPVDITDYVVEETAYRANLSSYSGSFPYSKAFAIYYTQGSPNIKGLFFKAPAVLNNAFKDNSIVNILKQVTGKSSIDTTYALYSFQITYKPIYNARFVHSKPYIDPDENERTLFYNQSENLIETSYYGENVKGAVARLGNAEQSLTYYFENINNIPKAGQLFDDDNYISAVMVQVMPSYLKCTVTLSKDFNRLSEYIGVKSLKYLYEVNERAAYDRTILLKEYIVIGNRETYPQQTLHLPISCEFIGIHDTIDGVEYWIGEGVGYVDKGHVVSIVRKNTNEQGYMCSYSGDNTIYAKVYVPYTEPQPTEQTATAEVNYITYTDTKSLIGYKFMDDTLKALIGRKANPVTGVIAQAKTKTNNAVGSQIALPVIASAFGNVMTFSWAYKDNYSAGEQSAYVSSSNISGYWAQDVPYKDYFGRFDYYEFSLTPGVEYETDEKYQPALDFPEVKGTTKAAYVLGTNATYHDLQYLVDADSREIINFNLQVEFRSNRPDIIIGSALANSNPFVNVKDNVINTKYYFFTERLNKFIQHAENQPGINLSTAATSRVLVGNGQISPLIVPTPPAGKQWRSWAIITDQTQETMTVEDSDGNVKTITKTVGGDVVLAGNWSDATKYNTEDMKLYFIGKHKLK